MRPLAIDLYTGLHGWAEGLIGAGFHVVGFDLEDMSRILGEPLPPEHFHLVIQDVLTLHGRQFKDAELIVGSSPCQEFSYRAMPWKRAKALGPPELGMKLFNAQFRIQREACEAAGRHIPMVVENVRGAQPWVGRARANFGSCYLWGDVPALMPIMAPRKVPGMDWSKHGEPGYKAVAFNGEAVRQMETGRKVAGFRFDGSGGSFQTAAVEHMKHDGSGWRENGTLKSCNRMVPDRPEGVKMGTGGWFNDGDNPNRTALMSSKSPRRRAASAKIAKIPLTLARWIGQTWLPKAEAAA